MGNRVTRQQMRELMRLTSLTPQDLGLPADLRVGPAARRRRKKSNVHAPNPAADMDLRPPGTVICAGCVVGRAIPWKSPDVAPGGGTIPTRDYNRYREWKAAVRLAVAMEMIGRRPYGHPVNLDVTFYLRPGGQHGDRTNLLKAFEDGAQKAAFANDRQVHGGDTNLVFTEDEPERVEYIVTAR